MKTNNLEFWEELRRWYKLSPLIYFCSLSADFNKMYANTSGLEYRNINDLANYFLCVSKYKDTYKVNKNGFLFYRMPERWLHTQAEGKQIRLDFLNFVIKKLTP